MGIKIKSIILIVIGVSFLTVGINMRSATVVESITKTVPGSKGRNASIGAGAGAVGGGILASVVGGIGIVACGTGVGLPAGAALIGTAAVLGAGGGAIAGAATGRSTQKETIQQITPKYETWKWASVIATSMIFFLLSVLVMRKLNKHEDAL